MKEKLVKKSNKASNENGDSSKARVKSFTAKKSFMAKKSFIAK